MIDFKTYFINIFQDDFSDFKKTIPINGNKHYDNKIFYIQYFYLTPQYNYLLAVPEERRGHFAVALHWIVLIDQVFYTYFRNNYEIFQEKTQYPKFIGNCTAPSLMTSQCGHHQHPRNILKAINDTSDRGNILDFDRDPFKKDESNAVRKILEYDNILHNSENIMRDIVQHFFEKSHFKINWFHFWKICTQEK